MSVFHGLSHVDLETTRLARTRACFTGAFGFTVRAEGEGFCDIDTSSCLIRLVETARVEHPTVLRFQVADVQAAWQRLVAAGLPSRYAPMRTSPTELGASVSDEDGHVLRVWRPLTEDEWDVVPELPKEQAWANEADALLKSLLKHVPALFRGLARRKVVREAESLAGGALVDRELVIRAFIRASSRPTRARARVPLTAHGIDPERYREDFDY